MDRIERERRYLQWAVAIGGIVPVGGGLFGALFGAALTGEHTLSAAGDSHYRYLSGLLLGIGLLFWSCLPAIETKGGRFRILTAIVVVGGLGRLSGLALIGMPGAAMLFALGMELVVTPAICLWQARVARQHSRLGIA